MPVCGHKLHDTCFEAVYGGVARARTRTGASLGLCGVCRRDMRLGDPSDHGKNSASARTTTELTRTEFAAISGQPSAREALDTHKVRSISKRTLATDPAALHDPADDDELVRAPPSSLELVRPTLSVRTEHATVPRPADRESKSYITCLVTVELPSRAPVAVGADSLPPSPSSRRASDATSTVGSQRPRTMDTLGMAFSHLPTPSSSSRDTEAGVVSLDAVVRDLHERMVDWKGHAPDDFGRLRLYDYLSVAKDKNTREFLVYLFDEALLCVAEDGPGPKTVRGLGQRIAARASSGVSVRSGSTGGTTERLRLKGRVFVRHVRRVQETVSDEGDLTLTITMGDHQLETFVMAFTERRELELWKAQIEALSARAQAPAVSPRTRDSMQSSDASDSGRSSYARSSATRTTNVSSAPSAKGIPEDDVYEPHSPPPLPPLPTSAGHHHTHGSVSTLRQPFVSSADLTPIDLVLVLSVPAPNGGRSQPSSGALKRRLIADTVAFIAENAGPRARISVVAFTAGASRVGSLRKTALIAVGSDEGASKIRSVIDDLASDEPSSGGPLSYVDPKDDRVNVVTAVNLGASVNLIDDLTRQPSTSCCSAGRRMP